MSIQNPATQAGDDAFGRRFDDLISRFHKEEQSLKQLATPDTSEQQYIVQELSAADKLLDQLTQSRSAPGITPMEVFGKYGDRSKNVELLKQILTGVSDISDRFQPSTNPEAATRSRRNVIYWIVAGVILNIVIAIIVSKYFAAEIASRLGVLISNTKLLAESKPLLPPLSGTDEIAQLDEEFHSTAQALDRATNAREELERQRQEFVQMINHDVRTPLSSWLSLLEAITSGVHGPVSDRLIERCNSQKTSANHTIKLLSGLLELEKLEAGKMPLQKESVDLFELVKHARDSVAELAAKQDVTIAMPPPSSPVLEVDSGRILQVIINLLANAIRFSPPKSTVRIEIAEEQDWLLGQGRLHYASCLAWRLLSCSGTGCI